MTEVEAEVSERRGISFIWVVPIVALLIGAWMIVYTIRNQGPEISITFDTAEGIEAGKTKVRIRNVEIGLVESVGLGVDRKSVVVTAQLEKDATELLREDTQFWVVRPRIGAGGVSGLGTLLSGGYIQLAPGTGAEGRRDFLGLEDPPVTPAGAPGLHLRLVSDQAGSVSTGDPILYKGFRVGRIESEEFDVESQQMHYGSFIEAPYDDLVNSSTRFWDASGVSFSATADGVELTTGSLQTLLIGGISFGMPEGVAPGTPVEKGATFRLYPDRQSMNAQPYRYFLEYVVQFDRSVRGLKPGAPVEYRGIRIGRVERILPEELAGGIRVEGQPIPVLLRLEPGRLMLPDSEEGSSILSNAVSNAVGIGLRASLATGSLLTGSLYVSMDIYPNAAPAGLGTWHDRPTIPTVATGLEGIQQKISELLDKLNALPLDEIGDSAADAVANLEAILASRSLQEMPLALEATVEELRDVLDSVSSDSELHARLMRTTTELDRTLRSMRKLMDTLDDQPNSVIFGGEQPKDPAPPAGTQ
jgi:paraquat-inducible protein B